MQTCQNSSLGTRKRAERIKKISFLIPSSFLPKPVSFNIFPFHKVQNKFESLDSTLGTPMHFHLR